MPDSEQLNTHLDGGSVAQLRNLLIHPVITDPTSPAPSQSWFRTDTGRLRLRTSGGTQTVAYLTDVSDSVNQAVASLGNFRGDWNASLGVPTQAGSTDTTDVIDAGDYWRVTTGGTIAGLGTVRPGDVIFARVANAATGTDFFVIRSSADTSQAVVTQTVTLASLPANTDTDVTPSLLAGGQITSYMVYDSSGNVLRFAPQIVQSTPKLVLRSLVAYTNLTIVFEGRLA